LARRDRMKKAGGRIAVRKKELKHESRGAA
jgi:hypothetical protein